MVERKIEELKQRFKDGDINLEGAEQKKAKIMAESRAYKSEKQYPKKDLRPGKIYVDNQHDAILLPVFNGKWIPLHVSFVKNISSTSEGQWQTMRLNLHVPGVSNLSQNMEFPPIKGPNGIYLREMSFKSTDVAYMKKTVEKIKTLVKNTKQRDKERVNNSDVIKADNLVPFREK